MIKDKLEQLRIELTQRCNLNCKDCYRHQFKSLGKELSVEEIINLIDVSIPIGLKTLSFSGGEPLLEYEKLKTLLSYSKSKDLETGLLTNGILVTKEVVKELENFGLEWARISLDGSNREVNSLTRGNSFDATVKAIKGFNASIIYTIVRTTIHKDNYQDIESMINLALELDLPKLEFQPYILLTKDKINEQFILPVEKQEELTTKLLRAKRYYKNILDISLLSGWFEFLSPEYKDDVRPKHYISSMHFDASHINSLHIEALGDIKTCGCNFVSLGNIRTDQISNVFFNSQYMNDLRNYNPSKYCPKCSHTDLCFPCPAPRTNIYGTVNAANPNCPKVRKGENK